MKNGINAEVTMTLVQGKVHMTNWARAYAVFLYTPEVALQVMWKGGTIQ